MKKMTNRIFSVIMALIMLMSIFSVAVSANDQNTEFSISVSGNIAVGEEITVMIAIENAEAVSSAAIDIQYNSDCIEFVELIEMGDRSYTVLGDETSKGLCQCGIMFSRAFSGDFSVVTLILKILSVENTDVRISATQWLSNETGPADAVFNLNTIESDDSLITELFYKYKIENGEVTITDCDLDIRGDVVIPDSIEGYPVTVIGNYAFSGCDSITSVVIPDSVKTIEEFAFSGCDGLVSATIGSGVTTLGRNIFWSCENLENVVIKEGVTCISQEMFSQCWKLKTVSIPESVTTIGEKAFSCCYLLEDIKLPSGLIIIENSTFYLCKNLKSVVVPDSVMEICDYAFYGCEDLASIIIPDRSISIDISSFSGTSYFSDSSNWDNGIFYIGNHLIYAKENITQCDIKEGTITIANSAFNNCSEIKNITIPDSVLAIGYDAFRNCTKLESVEISESVTTIGNYAFYDCTSLKDITIPHSVISIGDKTFGYYWNPSADYATAILDDFVVYGYEDTVAETYANENGIDFVALCKHETTAVKDAFDATCTVDGYTGDLCCADCDELLTNGEVIAATGHTEESVAGKDATCTETGLTEGKKCTVCGEILVAQEVIPATGHTEEAIPGKEATYTETGLTEGKKCSVCGVILVEQTEIPILEMPNLTPNTENITVTDTVAASAPEMSVETFIASVENENVQILDKDGKELAKDALVGTGSKINILDKEGKVLSTYEVMVKSDVDGNGKITPADARLALRVAAGIDTIAGVYVTAANYDEKETISTSDARMILRKAAGLE